MKFFKILILGPLSILCLKSTAQVEDLMRDKNITWIAESYNDVILDESLAITQGENTNIVTLLKFANTRNESVEEKYALQKWLIDAVANKKIPIFRDDNCTERCEPFGWGADSITTINPITYETEVKVVFNKPNTERICFFRTKQIIYYNAKKAQFGVRVLAIAPLISYGFFIDSLGVIRPKNLRMPLFWFKPTYLTKAKRLNRKNITLVRQINFKEGISISADSIKIIKKVGENMPLAHLFNAVTTNRRYSFYKRTEGIVPTKKISFKEREKMFERKDTIQNIDPITYNVRYTVIDDSIRLQDCEYLQLIQNWYWNNRKKRLEIYLVATATLQNRAWSGFKYPLFYRRTDD